MCVCLLLCVCPHMSLRVCMELVSLSFRNCLRLATRLFVCEVCGASGVFFCDCVFSCFCLFVIFVS